MKTLRNVYDEKYEIIYKDPETKFNGLGLHEDFLKGERTFLSGNIANDSSIGWFYTIGCISYQYSPKFPGFVKTNKRPYYLYECLLWIRVNNRENDYHDLKSNFSFFQLISLVLIINKQLL